MNLPEIDLRYPIGKFSFSKSYTSTEILDAINQLEQFPQHFSDTLQNFTDSQLDTPYRDGGWTVRQVVHHISDSHLHAYIRIKWALTESSPVIKVYNEKSWANTPEVSLPVSISLYLLKSLHIKLTALAKNIAYEDLARIHINPETQREISIGQLLKLYAWHGEHHLAQITALKKQKGWV